MKTHYVKSGACKVCECPDTLHRKYFDVGIQKWCITRTCKACESDLRSLRYEANREKILKKSREFYQNNKESERLRCLKYYRKNMARCKARNIANYRKKNA